MKIMAMGYVGFRSPNYAEWRKYGPDALAMPVIDDGDDGAIRLRMDNRHHRLAIHPGEQEELAYIGWELASRGAFEEALAELTAKGISYSLATDDELRDRRVLGMVSLEDPSGFRHELFWGQDIPAEPFWPTRYHRGYVGGSLGGAGHIVLIVPELTAEHSRFATDILGFTAFSYLVTGDANGGPVPIELYRCNERTHALIWVPVPGMKGISHIQFEFKYLDDLFRTYDMAKRDNHPIAMELGRFVADIDISFYLRSPSGWDIQMSWDDVTLRDGHHSEAAPAYDARGGKTVIWGYKPLLPFLNPSIRPISPADRDDTKSSRDRTAE